MDEPLTRNFSGTGVEMGEPGDSAGVGASPGGHVQGGGTRASDAGSNGPTYFSRQPSSGSGSTGAFTADDAYDHLVEGYHYQPIAWPRYVLSAALGLLMIALLCSIVVSADLGERLTPYKNIDCTLLTILTDVGIASGSVLLVIFAYVGYLVAVPKSPPRDERLGGLGADEDGVAVVPMSRGGAAPTASFDTARKSEKVFPLDVAIGKWSAPKRIAFVVASTTGLVVLIAVYALLSVINMVVLSAVTMHTSSSAQPNTLATIHSTIDGRPITIRRDANGLPHVTAHTKENALFAQGYLHAQDRLWQLEFQRLVAQGRLSEFVGRDAVKIDKQIRRLKLPEAALLMCANLPSNASLLLSAYAQGINHYLQTQPGRPVEFLFMSKTPLTHHEPAPFHAHDACYSGKLLQWQLSGNAHFEVQRWKLYFSGGGNLSYSDIMSLYPDYTNMTGTILSAQDMGLSEADAVAGRAREANDARVEQALYDAGGSIDRIARATKAAFTTTGQTASSSSRSFQTLENDDAADAKPKKATTTQEKELTSSWASQMSRRFYRALRRVVAPQFPNFRRLDITSGAFKRTHASNAWMARAYSTDLTKLEVTSGASDPHLETNLPSVWYYNVLSFNMNASSSMSSKSPTAFTTGGVGMVGIPGVHIGQTPHVFWGITMTITDIEDLYILPPVGTSGSYSGSASSSTMYYQQNGTQIAINSQTESMIIHGEDQPETIEVQWTQYGPVVNDVFGLPEGSPLMSLYTPTLQPDATSMIGILSFMDTTIEHPVDLRNRVFWNLRSPAFSVPIGGKDHTIAYTISGAHPLRATGHTGRVPTIGDGSMDGWSFIPMSETPTVVRSVDSSNVMSLPVGGGSSALQSVMPAGWVACANQKIYPDGYRYTLGYDYVYPYRGRRLQAVLANAEFMELVDIMEGGAGAGLLGSGALPSSPTGNTTRPAVTSTSPPVRPSPPSSPGTTFPVMPATARTYDLSNNSLHMALQTDQQSNVWVHHLYPMIFEGVSTLYGKPIAFDTGVFVSSLTADGLKWYTFMGQWSGRATIGSIQPTFLWFFLRWVARAPIDAIRVLHGGSLDGMPAWVAEESFPHRVLESPSPFITAQCSAALTYYGAMPSLSAFAAPVLSNVAAAPCSAWAAFAWNAASNAIPASFIATVPPTTTTTTTPTPVGPSPPPPSGPSNNGWSFPARTTSVNPPAPPPYRWGIDVSLQQLTNLMMTGTPLECLFNRQVRKSGDFSSVDVKEVQLNDPNLNSFGASSMRQVYRWKYTAATSAAAAGVGPSLAQQELDVCPAGATLGKTPIVKFAWPGGASEDPFSPLYDNLAVPTFSSDEYTEVSQC